MTNSVVSGSPAMIQPAWHHVSGSNDHRAGELYQTEATTSAGQADHQITVFMGLRSGVGRWLEDVTPKEVG